MHANSFPLFREFTIEIFAADLLSPHDAKPVELAGEPCSVVLSKSTLELKAANDLVDVLCCHQTVLVAAKINSSSS